MMQAPPQSDSRNAIIADRGVAISLCDRLGDTAARLTDLLAQETALLKSNKAAGIDELQSAKSELTKLYARDFGLLKNNAAFIGANAPTHTTNLRRVLRALHAQIEDNFNVLESKRVVSQGLISAIYEIASERNAGPTCYTSTAVSAQHTSRPTAIAVDKAL